MHTNGHGTRATIRGIGPHDTRLDGPGFVLRLTYAEDTTDVDIDGQPAPEQVLRALGQAHVFARANATRIHVRIETIDGHDEYIYTADMRHRLLFRRVWHHTGRAGVFYGLNPFVADTQGDPAKVPGRASLRNVVQILAKDGPLARIDVMNLFTYRSAGAAGLPARPTDRVAAPDLERDVLADADVVLLAWGAKVGARHRHHVQDLLDRLQDVGADPHMLQRDGTLLTVGSPPQPAHPARLGYRQIRAVQVDPATVLDPAAPSTQRSTASTGTSVPAPCDRDTAPRSSPSAPPSTRTAAQEPDMEYRERAQLHAWAAGYLDELGSAAVRKYLDGVVVAGPAPDPDVDLPPLPDPLEVAQAARKGDTAWGALQLATVALRVTDGVAWWKPAARYILANSASDRRKVSGTWGNPARTALERLYGLDEGTADDAAHSGADHDLDDTARRWGVSPSETGTIYGPGAPKQFGHDAVEQINDGSARPCYRRR